MMRRLILATTVAASLLLTAVPATARPLGQFRTATTTKTATITTTHRFVGAKQVPSCRFQLWDGHLRWTQDEVRYTIRCAVVRWPVPGGLDLALCIARRESGFNQFAANPTSSASGVYQFVSGTWAGQISGRAQFVKDQNLGTSVFNARSNVLIAIRYAHMSWSWAPWGGGC